MLLFSPPTQRNSSEETPTLRDGSCNAPLVCCGSFFFFFFFFSVCLHSGGEASERGYLKTSLVYSWQDKFAERYVSGVVKVKRTIVNPGDAESE